MSGMQTLSARNFLATTMVSLSSAVCCQAVHAEDDWIGGFTLLDTSHTVVRTERLNPNNFFGISSSGGNAAFLLEGSASALTFRGRIQQHQEFATARATDTTATLLELNHVFQLDDSSSLSIGKRLFSLDQSYLGQPLGFFQKQADLTDPTDAAGRAEGLPMVVYSWSNEKASLTGLYSNDIGTSKDGFNRGIKQWLLRAGYELKNLSSSLIVRGASGESVGIGATFSATLGDAASVYGSFYSAKGTLRPVLTALENGGPTFATSKAAALRSLRAENDVNYPRAALGAIYAPQNQSKIQLEFIYDQRGLSRTEYRRYLDLIHLHQASNNRNLPAAFIDANLSYDSSILLSRGTRRKYVSLSMDRSFDQFSVSCGSYIDLEDGSGIYYTSLSYAVQSTVTASLSVTSLLGKRDSERRLSPVSGITTARLKWLF
jgi:hypothetical protein